jgi:hypothetical protein
MATTFSANGSLYAYWIYGSLAFELSYHEGYASYELIGIGGMSDDIVIPMTYNGKYVTRIVNGAFAYCDSITSITIPPSIVIIDDCAFTDCSNLTNIIFVDGSQLMSIGEAAFWGCYNLTDTIVIPDSVTIVG